MKTPLFYKVKCMLADQNCMKLDNKVPDVFDPGTRIGINIQYHGFATLEEFVPAFMHY